MPNAAAASVILQAHLARQAQRERNNPLGAMLGGFKQAQARGDQERQRQVQNEQFRQELELRKQQAAVQQMVAQAQARATNQAADFRQQDRADIGSVLGGLQGLGQPVEQGAGGLISPLTPGLNSRPYGMGDIRPTTQAGHQALMQEIERRRVSGAQAFNQGISERQMKVAEGNLTERGKEREARANEVALANRRAAAEGFGKGVKDVFLKGLDVLSRFTVEGARRGAAMDLEKLKQQGRIDLANMKANSPIDPTTFAKLMIEVGFKPDAFDPYTPEQMKAFQAAALKRGVEFYKFKLPGGEDGGGGTGRMDAESRAFLKKIAEQEGKK